MLWAVFNDSRPALRRAGLLLLTFAAVFSVAWFGMALFQKLPFLAGDFRVYYTSGQLFLQGRASDIYDQDVQRELQAQFIQNTLSVAPVGDFVLPMPFLPVFVLLFVPFAALPPIPAYYLWTGSSVIVFLIGLYWLSRGRGIAWRPLLLLGVGFFPLVFGVMVGQVHALLFLGFTGFYLCLTRHAERSAGAWLSLLLIKPQYLPLFLVFLLWKRRWSALLVFALVSIAILTLSVLLVSGPGIAGYQALLSGYIGDPAPKAIAAASMLNWRALSLLLFGSESQLGFVTSVAVLTGATVLLALLPWRDWRSGSQMLEMPMLGLTAATLLTAFHSHTHGLVLLLPPAIGTVASARSQQLTSAFRWLIDVIAFGPTLVVLIWGTVLGGLGLDAKWSGVAIIPVLALVVIIVALNQRGSANRALAQVGAGS